MEVPPPALPAGDGTSAQDSSAFRLLYVAHPLQSSWWTVRRAHRCWRGRQEGCGFKVDCPFLSLLSPPPSLIPPCLYFFSFIPTTPSSQPGPDRNQTVIRSGFFYFRPFGFILLLCPSHISPSFAHINHHNRFVLTCFLTTRLPFLPEPSIHLRSPVST